MRLRVARPQLRGLKVTVVDLSNNQLTALPVDFASQLSDVVRLDLSKNKLTCLPDNFGEMTALRKLDLLGNNLGDLPLSFGDLKSLQWLDIKGNDGLEQVLGISTACTDEAECRRCAKTVVKLMQDRQAQAVEATEKRRKKREKEAAKKVARLEAEREAEREHKKAVKLAARQQAEREQESVQPCAMLPEAQASAATCSDDSRGALSLFFFVLALIATLLAVVLAFVSRSANFSVWTDLALDAMNWAAGTMTIF